LQLANQVLDELQQTSPTTIIKYCEDCQWSA
jgi:hypothetical protein